jgi:hypothetical protein
MVLFLVAADVNKAAASMPSVLCDEACSAQLEWSRLEDSF